MRWIIMITEKFDGIIYTSVLDGEIILTIERISDNTYHAKNKFTDMTVKVIPLDEYRTQTRCIEHKTAGKDGKFRKSKKLLDSNVNWLVWMLEEKGFISKRKPING